MLSVFKRRKAMKRKERARSRLHSQKQWKTGGVFMVLNFSYLVLGRLERFLHDRMFWDKFFCQGSFSFLKMLLHSLRKREGQSEEMTLLRFCTHMSLAYQMLNTNVTNSTGSIVCNGTVVCALQGASGYLRPPWAEILSQFTCLAPWTSKPRYML